MNKPQKILVAMTLLALLVAVYLYFSAFWAPYMVKHPVDALASWNVSVDGRRVPSGLAGVRRGEGLRAGDVVSLSRSMRGLPFAATPGAAIMFRTNHQTVRVFVGGKELYAYDGYKNRKNPGLTHHIVALPANSGGETLRLDFTSPYDQYAGAIGAVYFSDISSLKSFGFSSSAAPLVILVSSLLAGLTILALFLARSYSQQKPDWANFYLGTFAVVWALYAPSTSFAATHAFSPIWVSWISIGLYFLFPLPFMIFFLCGLDKYWKFFLPFVALRALFTLGCYALQVTGMADLPQMIDYNNAVYFACLCATTFFVLLECRKSERRTWLRDVAPCVVIVTLTVAHNLYVFYTRRILHSYAPYQIVYTLFILYLLAYIAYAHFKREIAEQTHIATLENTNQLAYENYLNIVENANKLAIIQHDSTNHLNALASMIGNGRTNESLHYINGLLEEMREVMPIQYTKNFLVNSIVGAKFAGAFGDEIEISHDIQLPVALDIADKDVCSVLSNILDNALAACKEAGEGQEKKLSLKLKVRNGFFCVVCSNSKAKEPRQSAPERRPGRGYGLESVRRTVERYGGAMHCEADDNNFVISVAMQNKAPQHV